MKSRKIFTNVFVGVVLLLIVVWVIFTNKNTKSPSFSDEESIEPPVFTWKYEEDSTLKNPDGLPMTNVILEAKYSNGAVLGKLVEKFPSRCNELPDNDKDSLPHTKNIQCYYAGLGYTFKITKGDTSYYVQRKTFEEAVPEYDPPKYGYEVVSQFPFINQ
ncbi:MAG TPA: hypothetical protein VK153_00665 [Candidatus Paceibacterota bacterium]|nr:hypothetical protein [Candidatus Paceibacterota bacterium]